LKNNFEKKFGLQQDKKLKLAIGQIIYAIPSILSILFSIGFLFIK
jgi:hypothetical protein